MKRITLCADDYSQSPAISNAILHLVEMGRLDAVSCLTLSPTWRNDARSLIAAENGQHIGLHFNLTFPFDQPERKVSKIMAACMLRTIDRTYLRKTFDTQWQSFVRFVGRPPDFVDGHQHVHVLPVVRDIIVEESQRGLRPVPSAAFPLHPASAVIFSNGRSSSISIVR